MALQHIDKLITPEQQRHHQWLSQLGIPSTGGVLFEDDVGEFFKGVDVRLDIVEGGRLTTDGGFAYLHHSTSQGFAGLLQQLSAPEDAVKDGVDTLRL